ncbi:MAG TPA: hypothetical protein VN653_13775 [Anaerolineales bacterium]|nr:hypothetical protein [Anaerolineales bacterium]
MITLSFRKNLFRLNAGFLILIGGVFTVLDYVGFKTGAGPLGNLLKGNFLAVGALEAHGLALIIGILLLAYAARSVDVSWHLVGVGVHVLLGGSNLIFWAYFQQLGIVNQEIVVTVIHLLLVVAHLLSYFSVRAKTQVLT